MDSEASRYTPLTKEEQEEMLETIGLSSIDELFAEVPREKRFPVLDLAKPRSEMELLQELRKVSEKNAEAGRLGWFLGAGAYNHFIPSVVSSIAERGEFLTAYTPYQPEVSQGTLQVVFSYQTMIANLLGMEVANASQYDGASALAEASLMALRILPLREQVVLHPDLHPEYSEVVRTYLAGRGILARSKGEVTEKDACFVCAFPTFTGHLLDLRRIAEHVHQKGALLVVHVDPIALGLFRSPGACGADIVTGEGQPLGNPMNFGGPYLGLFAVKGKMVRKMPGRVVGQTVGTSGNRGCVLTLAAREQHIRREKATSNICTNQGLAVLAATVYLAAMGKWGLKKVAELCYHKAHYAAAEIEKIPGCRVLTPPPFFKEFVVRSPLPAEKLFTRLYERSFVAGLPLSRYWPERRYDLLVCVTEMNESEQIDRFVIAMKEEIHA